MAIANLDTNKVKGKFNDVNVATLTAFDVTDGAEYSVSGADERTAVIVYNSGSSATNVTIKAPKNKIYTSKADKAVSVGAGQVALVMVESSAYMDAVTNKVTLAGSADVKAAVVVM